MQTISRIDPALLPTSHAKIEAALSAFDEYADPEPLVESFAGIEHKLTPSKFLHWMRQAARDNRQRIVLPEATDHRVIMAAAQAQRKGFAQVVLLGREDQIMQVCLLNFLHHPKCRIADCICMRQPQLAATHCAADTCRDAVGATGQRLLAASYFVPLTLTFVCAGSGKAWHKS